MDKQRAQLTKMLEMVEEDWKFLVFDQRGQMIINQVFYKQTLEQLGVTVMRRLKQPAERVLGVSAVYFIEPTSENIQLIAKDARRGLYSKFYINFTSSCPRKLLEEFAKLTAEGDFSVRIEKVYDQYTNYISLEETLFHFDLSQFYLDINTAQDERAQELIDTVVESLFSTCVTMDAMPVICFDPKDQMTKMVATQLKSRIGKQSQNLFTPFGVPKPLLLLLGRDIDFATSLHHGCTYQAMVHDLIGITNSKVVNNGKKYYLDNTDEFWIENKGLPFPSVEANHEKYIKKWAGKKNSMTLANDGTPGDIAQLGQAMNSVPEMNRMKDLVDKHANILREGLFPHLIERDIPDFYTCGESLLKNEEIELETLLEQLEKGSNQDKSRLLLIHYLTQGPGNEHEKLHTKIKEEFPDVSLEALQYLKLRSSSAQRSSGKQEVAEGSMFDKFISTANKALVAFTQKPATCETVKLLDRLSRTSKDEQFKYIDAQGARNLPPNYRNCIVFMLGGGNFNEYQQILDWTTSNMQIDTVIYGATHLPRPDEFLNELSQVGTQTLD